jgi:hypothetical protein
VSVCNRCDHKAESHGELEGMTDEKLDGLLAQLQQRLNAKRAEGNVD